MKNLREEAENPRYKWIILFASFLAFIAFAFAFQVGPPLIQAIMEEFKVSHAQAGLIMSVVQTPGVVLSLPAGLLVGRYGVRRIGTLFAACISLGIFVSAVANSFSILLLGRIILGLGGTFIVTAAPVVISQWFNHKELGRAMGIYGISMPFATIIAFPSASIFMLQYGWRFPFYVSLILAITAIAVFACVAREGPFSGSRRMTGIRKVVRNFEIWKVGLIWLFFNAAALSFTTWAPKFFVTYHELYEVHASLLASLFMWTAIPCVPFYGWFSDKTGRRKPFAVVGLLFMTLTLATLAYSSDLTLFVAVSALGIAAAMVPPIASTLPIEILGPTSASIGYGIAATCQNLGAASAQPLIGLLLDLTGSFTVSLIGMATLSAVGVAVAYTLKTR